MGFQKVEFSFPDEEKDDKGGDIEIESSGAIEIDIEVIDEIDIEV
jgi:hypothetical protein